MKREVVIDGVECQGPSMSGCDEQALRDILEEVEQERKYQDLKWGEQNHNPIEWLSILGEEYGEACMAANKAHWNKKPWADYRTELIETAAVCVAAVESLDRNGVPE